MTLLSFITPVPAKLEAVSQFSNKDAITGQQVFGPQLPVGAARTLSAKPWRRFAS
jgi:hypothetical protein